MDRPTLLLQRLDEIGRSLERSGQALALIGLGSVGIERARLDEYSDLDFFVIAKDGCKDDLIHSIGWLSDAHPVVYAFQNTRDGLKALFADDIYCEFAVFEVAELEHIPYAEGRVVWSAPGFDESCCRPRRPLPVPEVRSTEWLLGEALTYLYVGLCRYRRGEKLAAFRLVQVAVLDRIMELAALLEQPASALRDAFSPERRFEQRFPNTAAALAPLMPGYDATPQAALAIVEYLDRHFDVDAHMKAAILRLCRAPL